MRLISQRIGVRDALGRTALPVLTGPGRGLRVRVGDSNIRVAHRGEPRTEAALLELLSPGDVFYDIGANIGWYSLLAARKLGAEGRVVAFEPVLENAHYAQQNALMNGFENMIVVPVAVTDRDGWIEFLLQGSLRGRLAKDDFERQAEMRARGNFRETGRTLVPATRLDSWRAEAGERAPTVVKIDVEGAELGVLRGMRETIAAAQPTLLIELHSTREEVTDEVESHGYTHRIVESDLPTRQAPRMFGTHLLATPPSRRAGAAGAPTGAATASSAPG